MNTPVLNSHRRIQPQWLAKKSHKVCQPISLLQLCFEKVLSVNKLYKLVKFCGAFPELDIGVNVIWCDFPCCIVCYEDEPHPHIFSVNNQKLYDRIYVNAFVADVLFSTCTYESYTDKELLNIGLKYLDIKLNKYFTEEELRKSIKVDEQYRRGFSCKRKLEF